MMVILYNRLGGSVDDINEIYNLVVFNGEVVIGDWIFFVFDNVSFDIGIFNVWLLNLIGIGEVFF